MNAPLDNGFHANLSYSIEREKLWLVICTCSCKVNDSATSVKCQTPSTNKSPNVFLGICNLSTTGDPVLLQLSYQKEPLPWQTNRYVLFSLNGKLLTIYFTRDNHLSVAEYSMDAEHESRTSKLKS